MSTAKDSGTATARADSPPATGYVAATHTCAQCGYKWQSMDRKTEKHISTAAQVNGEGPFCNVCYHLQLAWIYADARSAHALNAGWHKDARRYKTITASLMRCLNSVEEPHTRLR